MPQSPRQLVEALFDAFNRRSEERISDLCDERIEFVPVTGALAGRSEPYVGRAGLREYLEDVERTWEELMVSAGEILVRGDLILVIGRVYARSRESGMRDLPAAWIWRLRQGQFDYGRGYPETAMALEAIAAADAGRPVA
jgi:ketosteroid isomerase-like protein